MKILSIGNFGRGWDGSICDEEHIAGALEELGHEVYRWSRQDIADDINQIKGIFDFVLIAQYDQYPVDLVGHLIKRYTDAPVVYWAYDYQADGQEWHERLIADSDLYLSKRIADSKYANWQWLSQDFAPAFLDRVEGVEKDIDVLFTGSYLPWATERNEIIEAVGKKYNLVIHSVNEWPQGNREAVMDDALPMLYARAKVVLSIDHTIEAGYWSDRVAQVMACGAFVLHRYQPLSSVVFRSYIGYFYDVESCFKSLDYWLSVDEDRDNLADVGYQYAKHELMVKNRVEDLLNIVQGVL